MTHPGAGARTPVAVITAFLQDQPVPLPNHPIRGDISAFPGA